MAFPVALRQALRTLFANQRVAALGSLDDDGLPYVSMVPYAVEPQSGTLVIHVSGLAAHTRHLQVRPQLSLLVMQAEVPGEPVHALPRITLEGRATTLQPHTPLWQASRQAYLTRFPQAEPMTTLPDFRFVSIEVLSARQVAGFGAARTLSAQDVASVWGAEA